MDERLAVGEVLTPERLQSRNRRPYQNYILRDEAIATIDALAAALRAADSFMDCVDALRKSQSPDEAGEAAKKLTAAADRYLAALEPVAAWLVPPAT